MPWCNCEFMPSLAAVMDSFERPRVNAAISGAQARVCFDGAYLLPDLNA